jgi:aldehyde dehydrogenase (NAD+)
MAELVHEAGFPPGVVNILSGDGKSGAVLSQHMHVQVLNFTGSTATGREIQTAAAQSNLKKVILELGGKSPAIIFDDADLDEAARATAHSVSWNAGQTCMANTRLYVHSSIAKEFIEKYKFAVQEASRHGDPLDESVSVGPVADGIQYDRIKQYMELGASSGETVLGGIITADKDSLFVPPTIFTACAEDSKIMREEVFGPITNINTFEEEQEAVDKANDTSYGLYGAVFTKNIDRALHVAQKLECGSVAINCTSPTGAFDMPFGGYKLSGQGREGLIESLENYLELKTVLVKIK